MSTTTQIFERSLQNNRYCFVEQARSAGYLKSPDFDVLDEWFQWMNANIDIDINYIGIFTHSFKFVSTFKIVSSI